MRPHKPRGSTSANWFSPIQRPRPVNDGIRLRAPFRTSDIIRTSVLPAWGDSGAHAGVGSAAGDTSKISLYQGDRLLGKDVNEHIITDDGVAPEPCPTALYSRAGGICLIVRTRPARAPSVTSLPAPRTTRLPRLCRWCSSTTWCPPTCPARRTGGPGWRSLPRTWREPRAWKRSARCRGRSQRALSPVPDGVVSPVRGLMGRFRPRVMLCA